MHKLLTALTLGLGGIALVAAPAQADPTDPPAPGGSADHDSTYYTITISDQAVDPNTGANIGSPETTTYRSDSAAYAALPQDSEGGTKGTSSASGCHTATVSIDKNSFLGANIFQYNESTGWCWYRSLSTVTKTHPTWWLSEMGSNANFVSQLWSDTGFYNWGGRGDASGYRNRRQAHLTNEFPLEGTLSHYYPEIQIWAHSNGTWSWRASCC